MIGCQSVSSSKYLQLWVSVTPGSPTPVPPTVRAGITKRRKENNKNILNNKASLPPPPPVAWRSRAQTAATRAQAAATWAQAAAGLIPDVMLPAPPPPPGSLIDKELTQYDALIDRWANVTTRRQETLRCLGCLCSLCSLRSLRARMQLVGLEPVEAVQIRNFSAATSVCCNNATSRPDRPEMLPVN